MLQDLTGTWEVKEASSTDAAAEAEAPGEWLEAAVPGCIHLDLMRAGRIPDPFHGFNDLDVQWVAQRHWLYRRRFACKEGLSGHRRVELVCEGIDTFARVLLNGQELGRADNMFHPWRWDVTGLLRDGQNELLLLIESPKKVGAALMEEHGRMKLWDPQTPERPYVRKAQYEGGWDWAPNLNTSGIWRPIRLEACNAGRLADVCARIDWSDPDVPVVKVSVELEALAACGAEVRARLIGPEDGREATASADLEPGTGTVELSLPVEQPRLWWPAGMGEPALYELKVAAYLGEERVGERCMEIGLRRVELREEEDDEPGTSFVLHVNGEPVFCRGANWVPADSFLPRVTAERYEELVGRAAEANMNMLRVWGGGIYEHEAFYRACDRLGIMVWQDFMFACAAYPDHLDWFGESVRVEAEHQVRRLRNHPCVALWCGNNENYQLMRQTDTDGGVRLYEDVLPEVCERLDPTRPYRRSSPYGGEDPNDPTRGDQHAWGVWHGLAHPESHRRHNGRFISEFGVQAPANLETIRQCIPASGHDTLSRAMEHHNRMHEGTTRMYRYLSALFRVPGEFADAVYMLQLTQAECIRTAVEHWRSRKFRTAGALFWQHNDCWPCTSWSCLDYDGRPKALWHAARRFFAPLLPVLDVRDGQFTARIVNDAREPFSGHLVCGLSDLEGDQQWLHREAVEVPPNGVLLALEQPMEELDLRMPQERYLWCRLLQDEREVARSVWTLLPTKHVELRVPEWQIEVERTGERAFAVELTGGTFARGVWLRLEGEEGEFSDNFFDALPEVPIEVTLETTRQMAPEEVHRRLRVRSVAEVRQRRPLRP